RDVRDDVPQRDEAPQDDRRPARPFQAGGVAAAPEGRGARSGRAPAQLVRAGAAARAPQAHRAQAPRHQHLLRALRPRADGARLREPALQRPQVHSGGRARDRLAARSGRHRLDRGEGRRARLSARDGRAALRALLPGRHGRDAAARRNGHRSRPGAGNRRPPRRPHSGRERPRRATTCLVVEDTPDVIRLVAMALQQDFKMLSAADGLAGLEVARKELPSLIVTDLMMPGLDGLELTRRLRDDPKTRHIPIVMLTARGELDDRVAGIDTGVNTYLAKPFSPRELLSTARGLVKTQAAQADILL